MELLISSIVLSLFLFAAYATLEIGLKSWQLGETKTDIHHKAEIVLSKVMKDFKQTNLITVDLDEMTGFKQHICIETPVNNATGKILINRINVGAPFWQGHVIYFLYPPLNSSNYSEKKNLYRRYVPRPDARKNSLPEKLLNLPNYINTNDIAHTLLSVVAKDIYSISFDRNNDILSVEVSFIKNIRKEASVMFSPEGPSSLGFEIISLKGSVIPDN